MLQNVGFSSVCAFSSVVRQMPGYNSQRLGTASTLPNLLFCVVLFVIRVFLLLIVMFYVLFLYKCVLPPGVNPTAVDKYINISDWARPTFFQICYFVLFFVIHVVLLLIVMFYVLFLCKCVLPPGVNPTAVDKYINISDWARPTLFQIYYFVLFFVIHVVLLLIVMFCVLFLCKCVLPPGVNPIAVDKYININISNHQRTRRHSRRL
jgi:hypothetical protein